VSGHIDDDLAASDRRRLDKLIGFDSDPALVAASPDQYPGDGPIEWAAGFEDAETAVKVSVWFVRDPTEREAAAARLTPEGTQTATNGAMLFHGRATSPQGTEAAAPRLRQLVTRFAGDE